MTSEGAGRRPRLIVDENIPLAREAYSSLGEVTLLPGRNLRSEDLKRATGLLVRSITRVNADLLHGTGIRFVGTATIGTDHLDIGFLENNNIAWASAAGCNARSVVEWVMAALTEVCRNDTELWRGKTLGIVGHGNIGSRLAPLARALGMKVLVCDPPLHRAGRGADFLPLAEILPGADFLTLHVPNIKSGQDRTHHLIGAAELGQMKPGAVLLNASRGNIVDSAAALAAARNGHVRLVLDVFEGEPTPDPDLLKACTIATPHIAGYSHEGKVNGTRMIGQALAGFLNLPYNWEAKLAPPPAATTPPSTANWAVTIRQAIRHSYDITEDHEALAKANSLTPDAAGAYFDGLRKNYRERREFGNYDVAATGLPDGAAEALRALGFKGLR